VRAVTATESATLDERRQVLGDELRMFALAVSRARRRVVLAAVANDDEGPSVFLGFAPADSAVLTTKNVTPLSLRAVVGQLRKELVAGRSRAAAAASLSALAAARIPGADPDDWHGLLGISTDVPLYEGQAVPVSPSSLATLEESPLDWFLESMATSDSGVEAKVGTLLHAAMETAESSDVDGLWSIVESRWSELIFEAPWLAERQRHIARRLTEALSEYLRDAEREGKTVVGTELGFELTVDRAVVRGKIDRVERSPDGGVMIVDLKTGAPEKSQSKIDEHPQLGAYQLALADGALAEALDPLDVTTPQGAKLVFVKEGVRGRLYREAVQAPLDDEQLAAFRERVRRGALIIAAAEFAGTVDLPSIGRGDTSRLQLNRVRAVSSD
jgi:RecB family exonuclease